MGNRAHRHVHQFKRQGRFGLLSGFSGFSRVVGEGQLTGELDSVCRGGDAVQRIFDGEAAESTGHEAHRHGLRDTDDVGDGVLHFGLRAHGVAALERLVTRRLGELRAPGVILDFGRFHFHALLLDLEQTVSELALLNAEIFQRGFGVLAGLAVDLGFRLGFFGKLGNSAFDALNGFVELFQFHDVFLSGIKKPPVGG